MKATVLNAAVKCQFEALWNFASKSANKLNQTFIFWDAERKAFVATDGRALMVSHMKEQQLKHESWSWLPEVDTFYRYEKGILLEADYKGNYVYWWRVIPDYKKFECQKILPFGLKKYQAVNLGGDAIHMSGKRLDLELFDKLKPIIGEYDFNLHWSKNHPMVILTDTVGYLEIVIMSMVDR